MIDLSSSASAARVLQEPIEALAAIDLSAVAPAAHQIERALQKAIKRRIGGALLRGPDEARVKPEPKVSWVPGYGWLVKDDVTFDSVPTDTYRGPDKPDEEWVRLFELAPCRYSELNRLFPMLQPKHALPPVLDDRMPGEPEATAAIAAIADAVGTSDYVSEFAFARLVANLAGVAWDRERDAARGLDLAASTAMFRDALLIRWGNATAHVEHVVDLALVWRVIIAGRERDLYERLRRLSIRFIPSPASAKMDIEMLQHHYIE